MDYVKNRSVEFAKWLIISGMWRSDLTFEEMYEIWMEKVMVEEYEEEKWNEMEMMGQWDI
jgi:hypothetical protein